MMSGSDIFLLLSAPLARADDFDVVACLERRVAPCRTRNDSAVECDRDAALAGIDSLLCQQDLNGRGGEWFILAIHANCLVRHRKLPTPPPAPARSAQGRRGGSPDQSRH